MGVQKIARVAIVASLVATPALAGGLAKTITLPDGRIQQITVLVPESKTRNLENRGFSRSSRLATRTDAVRYRDGICRLAVKPPPRAKAPFAQMCSDANAAVSEITSSDL